MESEWYYTSKGVRCGPVSFATLIKLAKLGRLVPKDYVWTAGMSDWEFASAIAGLFTTPPPVVAVTPALASTTSDSQSEKMISGLPINVRELKPFIADLPSRSVVQIFPFGHTQIEMQKLRQLLVGTSEDSPLFHTNSDFVLIRARKKDQWLCLEYQWTFWIHILNRKSAFIEASGQQIREIDKVISLSLAQFQTGIQLAELRTLIVQLRFFKIQLEKRLRHDPNTLVILDQPLKQLEKAFDYWRDDSGICNDRFVGYTSLSGGSGILNGITVAYLLNSYIEQHNKKYLSDRHSRVMAHLTEGFGQLRALQLAIS
jgi:hypothetical protein